MSPGQVHAARLNPHACRPSQAQSRLVPGLGIQEVQRIAEAAPLCPTRGHDRSRLQRTAQMRWARPCADADAARRRSPRDGAMEPDGAVRAVVGGSTRREPVQHRRSAPPARLLVQDLRLRHRSRTASIRDPWWRDPDKLRNCHPGTTTQRGPGVRSHTDAFKNSLNTRLPILLQGAARRGWDDEPARARREQNGLDGVGDTGITLSSTRACRLRQRRGRRGLMRY